MGGRGARPKERTRILKAKKDHGAMTTHPIKQYFEARRNALIQLSEAVVIPHSGTAGAAREMLIRELLTSHLPPALGVGTGLVLYQA